MKKPVSITTVRFPIELFERLKMLAEEDDRSFNNFVIKTLETATKENDHEKH